MFQVTVKEIGGENVDVYICTKAEFFIPEASSKEEDYMDVLDRLLTDPASQSVINLTGVTNMSIVDTRNKKRKDDIRDQLVIKAEELNTKMAEIYVLLEEIKAQEIAGDLPSI